MKRYGGGHSDWLSLTEAVWPIKAERAIEAALADLDEHAGTKEQLGDLADAVDAYVERSFYVAKALAEASVRSRKLPGARPEKLNRTLSELKANFERARRALHEFPGDDKD